MTEKHKLHNVRFDDEVWAAIKALDCSLNQYLRDALLAKPSEPNPLVPTPPRPPRRNKRERVAQELAASDVAAQVVERDDIEYGHHETLPRGEHVANAAFKGQLLRPSEKKKR